MSYGKSITIAAPFAETVQRVREELSTQGFGVLTEINVTATLQEKLGEEMEDYVSFSAPATPPWHTPRWSPTATSACCCPATSSSARQTDTRWSPRWTRRSWWGSARAPV